MDYCDVCNQEYKHIYKHYSSKKHCYNMFNYEFIKHIDVMILTGEITENERHKINVYMEPIKEGNDKLFVNNINDIHDLFTKTF